MVGAPGTAKTSTAIMYMSKFSPDTMLAKNVNFSSATTPLGFQKNIEAEIERKTGKTFCPPGGKTMTVFIDDASMPLVNTWGDQVTNEITRQLIEQGGFYFLDKDKRGDFKIVEGLQYVAAMDTLVVVRMTCLNVLNQSFSVSIWCCLRPPRWITSMVP
jgi:dynein heavy chain